ncbi:MAG: ygaU [Rhizobacter sp.]|nr:ygaU [Rhizobacter sp.]
MSLISFIKDAGEKLFGGSSANAAPAPAAATATAVAPSTDKVADLNAAAGAAIKKYIEAQQLKADNLQVTFDGATHTVTVAGAAADQATKEKIVLCCGNVASVEKVEDQLTVAAGGTTSKFHTVVSGDTLSKIAQQEYGNASQYNKIFEANKPMLSNPDKIYPGQVLRIPA